MLTYLVAWGNHPGPLFTTGSHNTLVCVRHPGCSIHGGDCSLTLFWSQFAQWGMQWEWQQLGDPVIQPSRCWVSGRARHIRYTSKCHKISWLLFPHNWQVESSVMDSLCAKVIAPAFGILIWYMSLVFDVDICYKCSLLGHWQEEFLFWE